jgi:hypothetical protein
MGRAPVICNEQNKRRARPKIKSLRVAFEGHKITHLPFELPPLMFWQPVKKNLSVRRITRVQKEIMSMHIMNELSHTEPTIFPAMASHVNTLNIA